MSRPVVRFRSIRQQLLTGFWLLVGLFVAAGLAARASMLTMSTVIGETLAIVQEDAQLAARLSASVTQELAAASRYLPQGDSIAQEDFRRFSADAHQAQRTMNRNGGKTLEEVALIASIDAALSTIETYYALAHRLADLRRDEESARAAGRARDLISALTGDVEELAQLSTRKVTAASSDLRRKVEQRDRKSVV